MKNTQSSFFSMALRMKYINRWGLMRNLNKESLSEHSLDVAVLAHCLAVISKVRLKNENVNPEHVAVLAMYHDVSEIITGDMPTPVKYHNQEITKAYKQVEKAANDSIFNMLPDDLKDEYDKIFHKDDNDSYSWKLVKAADKLSALIKCIEEEKSGNTEFQKAKQTILNSINENIMDEVKIFMDEFYDSFLKTLDEQ